MVLDKHFDPATAERGCYARWLAAGCFDSQPQSDKNGDYCIVLPPPNVTGTLHMGHAFQHTLMDALVRREKMRGKNVLWQAGTDHAGIATQIVVARDLEKRGIDAKTLSREEFLRYAWQWKEQSGNVITSQMRRIGAACDWSRERFTMDEGLSEVVNNVFVRLYDEGLIYRGKRLVNWDPVMLTAVSDLEVVSEEEDGVMHYVRYPFLDNPAEGIVIATTRPETILVDGAVAVNPLDSRFKDIIGRRVIVPMTEPQRDIAIIADEVVDPKFGSGCVKITAAHDFNDYAVSQRHPDIPMIILLTPDAKMNENAPRRYRGLDRFDARRRIVEDLRQSGLLLREEAHRYHLPRGDRSGAVVEPMLTDQWFVRADKLATRALAAVAEGRVRFVPPNWRKTYNQWLRNIQDWCVSRQLAWGHRIPAWYDENGEVYVAQNEQQARAKVGQQLHRHGNIALRLGHRHNHPPPYNILKAGIQRIDRHRAIYQNRFRARCCDNDSLGGIIQKRITDIMHNAVFFFADDFQIGNGGEHYRIPINQTLAAINQTFVIQAHKNIINHFRQTFVHRKTLARPIASGADAAHLRSDNITRLFLPLPCITQKLLARKCFRINAALFQIAGDNNLRGDSGMVGACLPQYIFTAHFLAPHQSIHQRMLKSMPHVQSAGNIRRRQDNTIIAVLVALRLRIKTSRRQPACITTALGGCRVKMFIKHHRARYYNTRQRRACGGQYLKCHSRARENQLRGLM